MAPEVTDNADLRRFEIRLDGELAGFSDYHPAGDVIVFTHTEVDPKFRGEGLGTALVRGALDIVRAHGYAVRPLCPMVRAFIAEHDEYRDLVPGPERADLGG
jgi:predicted GNAT family acetyltransferase